MLNVNILTNRILEILEEDKSLARDVIDTCEVIDSARKDLFKQKSFGYVEAYSNVWSMFLERIGAEVTLNVHEQVINKPDYMVDHIHRLERPGYYSDVHEISFVNAYGNVTIDAKFFEGKMTIKLGGELVPISMIMEAAMRVRGALKQLTRKQLFPDEYIEVQIRAMKILLNTHYVALLTLNQRTEVGTVQAERFQNVVNYCREVGLKVILGHVDEIFVQGGADLVEETVEQLSGKFNYALHHEHHDRCIFENTKKFVLNIQGRFVGYNFKERK